MLRTTGLALVLAGVVAHAPLHAQAYNTASERIKKAHDLCRAALLRTDTDNKVMLDWCAAARTAVTEAMVEIEKIGTRLEPDDEFKPRVEAQRAATLTKGREFLDALGSWEGKLRSSDYRISGSDLDAIKDKLANFAFNQEPSFSGFEVLFAGRGNHLNTMISGARSSADNARRQMDERRRTLEEYQGRRNGLSKEADDVEVTVINLNGRIAGLERSVQDAEAAVRSAYRDLQTAEAEEARACDEYLKRVVETPSDPAAVESTQRTWAERLDSAKRAGEAFVGRKADRVSRTAELQANRKERQTRDEMLVALRAKVDEMYPRAAELAEAVRKAGAEYCDLDKFLDRHVRWQLGYNRELGR